MLLCWGCSAVPLSCCKELPEEESQGLLRRPCSLRRSETVPWGRRGPLGLQLRTVQLVMVPRREAMPWGPERTRKLLWGGCQVAPDQQLTG